MEKVILHIDGDSFFASCEVSLDPSLKGKPVVTGWERGIATAMSQEAKALGISRGMPIFQIKKHYPEVIVTHSHYETYGIFSQRMYDIVRRYTPVVEEYSIDECFGDITGLIGPYRALQDPLTDEVKSSKEAKVDLGKSLKEALSKELGMTFSIGIGSTKSLAKVASKYNKPDGLTVIEPAEIESFLHDLPIAKIWGIGPQTTRAIESKGVKTALDFIQRPEDWVKAHFSRPVVEIWHELRGTSIRDVYEHEEDQKSIQKTRTFVPATGDASRLMNELSKNVEAACTKLRRHRMSCRRVYYFLKTSEFRYHRKEIVLVNPLSNPNDILREIEKTFKDVCRAGMRYRATGVTLSDLVDRDYVQSDLFGSFKRISAWGQVFDAVDALDKRHGSHSVILGSSLEKLKIQNLQLSQKNQSSRELIKSSINSKKNFRIPFMGEVS